MKYLCVTVLLVCLLAVGGCEQRNESLIVESGCKFIKDTMADYYASDEGIFLVVWHGLPQSMDSGHGSTGYSSTSSTKKVEVHGSFWTSSSKTIEYSCRTSDGEKGAVVIDRAEYDLTKGCVFLVGEQDGSYSVSQLDLDLSNEYKPRYTLESLVNTVPQIAEFVHSFNRLE